MSVELLQLTLSAAALSAFLIGLSFGSGPCNLSCLPYLGPVLLGPASSSSLRLVILPFMGGRLSGYLILGVTAAAIGQVLQELLQHPGIPVFVSAVTLWLAVKMLRQAPKQLCNKTPETSGRKSNIIATDGTSRQQGSLQLFVLGFSLALTPCVPLLGLLTVAAQSADILWGGLVALCFGIGAILIPSLLVRYGVALLGNELRNQLNQWQVGLTRTGAMMLILVAVSTALRGVPA